MPEINKHEQIWKSIKNSEKLFEIYKYFPTLHDAAIKGIDVSFEKKEFSLTVDYSDAVDESVVSISTRITLLWHDVQKADFNWYAEDLYGMKFSKCGEFIKTKFADYVFGFDGEIISGEIEVKNIEVEPEKNENYKKGAIKFSLE